MLITRERRPPDAAFFFFDPAPLSKCSIPAFSPKKASIKDNITEAAFSQSKRYCSAALIRSREMPHEKEEFCQKRSPYHF
jgi:hypothetical protein